MKFAIALLVVCFVSTSYQVQPRPHYIPLYYADGLPAGYDVVDWAKAAQMRNSAPVKRLLGNLLPPISPPITLTSTTTEIATSTITTATVVNCIPTSLFNDTTTPSPCAASARRRRGIEVNDELNPSATQPVEPTAVADEILFEDKEVAAAEILSSKTEETSAPQIVQPIQARAGTLTTAKMVTVTSTTIEFVPTTITSIRLIAAESGLVCLPSGYAVCN